MVASSITLVRHGRTSYNAAHKLQGQVDIPLDDLGLWQVSCAANALRKRFVEPKSDHKQIVISSDLTRAMQTAHAFADPLGLEVHPDARVRERSFGQWDGRAVSELEAAYPEDFALWRKNAGGELKYGAEPKSHVAARGSEAIFEWAQQASDNTDLFFFSHGAWIAQTLQGVLGIDRIDETLSSIGFLRNAHWVRLIVRHTQDDDTSSSESTPRYCLAQYNCGPEEAFDVEAWDPTSYIRD